MRLDLLTISSGEVGLLEVGHIFFAVFRDELFVEDEVLLESVEERGRLFLLDVFDLVCAVLSVHQDDDFEVSVYLDCLLFAVELQLALSRLFLVVVVAVQQVVHAAVDFVEVLHDDSVAFFDEYRQSVEDRGDSVDVRWCEVLDLALIFLAHLHLEVDDLLLYRLFHDR